MKQKIICSSVEDYIKAGNRLLSAFPNKKVYAFYGKMGVGKTTLIKTICKNLGVQEMVNSPSFAIINEYKTDTDQSVFHMDYYRIKKIQEAYDIGYEDYIYSGSYCFIEWPEMIEELLPEDVVIVRLEENITDHSRVLTF